MNAVRVVKSFLVTGVTRDGLEESAESVMEALIGLEDETLRNSDVSVDLGTMTAEVSVSAGIIDSFEEAAQRADAAIRTAIHATGGHTPHWENLVFNTQRSEADLITA